MLPEIKKFILSFLKDRGVDPEGVKLEQLQGDGSKRVFWRITSSVSGLGKIAILGQPPICPLCSINTRFAYASRIEKIYFIFSKRSRYWP
jgi:hypothetical protein